eukprot:gnl/Chilomastix_caulleri/4979.p1 GENE.gnl/Chilomastix_caulleri/4979~~gnl/Chilomastix_caulleri/4979.p1  ORF type:complete len:74 (+),score=14.28 gnl/Chilomastix_caulleri/4979:73-294(+)
MFALLLVLFAAVAAATDVPKVEESGCQEVNNIASCCAYENIGFIEINACANIEIRLDNIGYNILAHVEWCCTI